MVKGTASKGKHSKNKSHIRCRRCGRHSYHIKTGICSACGFGRSPKIRSYAWSPKKVNKKRIL